MKRREQGRRTCITELKKQVFPKLFNPGIRCITEDEAAVASPVVVLLASLADPFELDSDLITSTTSFAFVNLRSARPVHMAE